MIQTSLQILNNVCTPIPVLESNLILVIQTRIIQGVKACVPKPTTQSDLNLAQNITVR